MRGPDERESSVATPSDNQSATRAKPEIDLSSPLFNPNQYLAVTHGVRRMCVC